MINHDQEKHEEERQRYRELLEELRTVIPGKPGQDVVYISSDLRRLAIWTLLRNPFVVV